VSQLTVQRLVDSFFRRWLLCLLPVVALVGLGTYTVLGQDKTYRSVGSMNVATTTLITTLTDVRGNQGYGYDTPSGATAKQLSSLLQTDQFVHDVVSRAGLDDALASGVVTLRRVRSGLSAWSNGPNLLMVAARSSDPVASQHLATATIDSFVDSIVRSNLGDSAAAQTFFTDVLKQYQADVDIARGALDSWVKANPAPGFGRTRPEDEQTELKRLNDNLAQATDRYNAAVSKSDSAQLSALQTKSEVAQRLKVVDAPALPLAPEAGLKAIVLKLGLFAALGALMGGLVVVMSAMLDRTVRLPVDVRERLHLRLLTSVPDAGAVPFTSDSAHDSAGAAADDSTGRSRRHRRRDTSAIAVRQAS
jgi:hypothetical protein